MKCRASPAIVGLALVLSGACRDSNPIVAPPLPTLVGIGVTMGAVAQPWPREVQMVATGHFSDTYRDLTSVVAWHSSTPSVATVSATGFLTEVGEGTVIITATYQGKSGSMHLLFGGPPGWDY